MMSTLLDALEKLGRDKGIERDFLIKTIELALQSASRKKVRHNDGEPEVSVEEDGEALSAFIMKEVVENETNPLIEISLPKALSIDENAEIGQSLKVELDPRLLGRNAAQTAKQVIIQRIQEAERGNIFDEYKDRLLETVTATVQRVEPRYAIIQIGRTEALLPFKEQPFGEKYYMGERIKSVIIDVRNVTRGAQVVVSRSHPKLVKDLFTAEVPEITDGVIEIKAIAREAGERTKIAVYSTEKNVDPVGACVGIKGQRVQAIVRELRGEKIDIIEWSSDPVVFIKNSLSPAEIKQVSINEKEKCAQVVVEDSQLSLAIGKKGQNVRLTAKLTTWKIDIIKEDAFKAQEKSKLDLIFSQQPASGELAEALNGIISDKLIVNLTAAEIKTTKEIADLGLKGLKGIPGIGPKTAEKILAAIK